MVALFVLITILAFVLIDMFVQRAERRKSIPAPVPGGLPVADTFLVPRGYFLSHGHSWVEVLFSGNARIGIDDFVQKLVGSVDGVRIVPVDTEIRKGEELFSITQGGRVLSVPSPLSGTVVEVNSDLLQKPETLNNDPYVSGWGVIVRPTMLASEVRLFTIADSAASWLRREVSRFRDFIKVAAEQMSGTPLPVGVTLLDGGTPVAGVLRMTDEKTWKAFQNEFLTT